ncbi:MAG: COX15/CtaA family protein [Sphingobacteriaceae bacterium]|nr:COX15/CtaA family protein [Sphingobacteriaceae bacterium]
MISKAQKTFIKLNFITIIVTLVVILAGALVRTTGAGMGCPDWPKCFDQYIPPTSLDQLPADYKLKYVEQRVKKNNKFADFLDKIGRNSLANDIRNDKSILIPEDFNALKTWTEYLNRLVGAVTGVFLLTTAIYSFSFRSQSKRIYILSVLNIFVVVYQAWLGSIVVSTNLTQWIVTIHMLLALLILAISIYTYHFAKQIIDSSDVALEKQKRLIFFVLISFAITIFQIVIGTEVREMIDNVARNFNFQERNTWITKVGDLFNYHRDLALVVTAINLWVYKLIKDKFTAHSLPTKFSKLVLLLICVQLLTGIVMSYFALPPAAQAVHILISTLLFCSQFYLLLVVNRNLQTYYSN